MSHKTKYLAKVVGDFIDSRGPAGATAREVELYCKVGGIALSRPQVNRALAHLWVNGWTPAGKTHRVTRTRVGNGMTSRYVMGTHASRQQQDDARLARMLEGVTRCERDARQADIILESNPSDMAAIADRSASLASRHSYCASIRLILSRNPHYAAALARRSGWMAGSSLLDDVMAA